MNENLRAVVTEIKAFVESKVKPLSDADCREVYDEVADEMAARSSALMTDDDADEDLDDDDDDDDEDWEDGEVVDDDE